MKRSDSIAAIAKALNETQKEVRDIFKSSQGYGYNYAPLDKVYDEIRPAMTAQGLSLTHEKRYDRETNTIHLTSTLMHESGEWIEYHAALPFAQLRGMNDYQSAGSGFTYLERYQTSAIFAITADEDTYAEGQRTTAPVDLTEINRLIEETKIDLPTLLRWAGAPSLEALTPDQAAKVLVALKKKANTNTKETK